MTLRASDFKNPVTLEASELDLEIRLLELISLDQDVEWSDGGKKERSLSIRQHSLLVVHRFQAPYDGLPLRILHLSLVSVCESGINCGEVVEGREGMER